MLPNIETLENQAQMGMSRKPPNSRRVEKTQWASKYKKRAKKKKEKG